MRAPTGQPARRDRFRRQIRAGLVLQERDVEMLADLFLHGVMARGQIQALYFGKRPQTATARLRLLFDHGYLRRSYPEEAPYGAQAGYGLAAKAVPLVAARLQLPERQVRERLRKSPTPLYRAHALAVVDFRLALLRQAPEAGAEVVEWAPELLCRHEYTLRRKGGGAVRHEVFRPDGFLRLRRGSTVFDGFLELDLGHTAKKAFLEKIASFARFVASGLYGATYGEAAGPPALLVQTTGERRLSHLLEAAAEREGPDVRFTTAAEVADIGPLGPVWRAAGGGRSTLLPPARAPPGASDGPSGGRVWRSPYVSCPKSKKGDFHGTDRIERPLRRLGRR